MTASRPPLGLMHFKGVAAQKKIGIFRALQLGDMMCAVPALRALRAAAPHAHVTLIGLPWAVSFAKRFSRYIDAHVSFPGFPGLPEHPVDIARIPGFIKAMQEQRFDFMLQMHGSGALTNSLVTTFGADKYAGFYQEGNYCPDPAHFMAWDEAQHEVTRNVQLMEFLGIPAQGEDLEFPLRAADYHALFACQESLPAPGSYVCIHPGARMPSRRWDPARFAEVADRLHADGLRVVLTGSPQEAELVRSVQRSMRAPALNLAGKTELGAFAALIAQARLLVCNETGISHMAAAVKTPSVVICCGGDAKRWAALNWRRHRSVHAEVPCRPCAHQVCPIGHPCATQVTSNAVWMMARQVLADNPPVRTRQSQPQPQARAVT